MDKLIYRVNDFSLEQGELVLAETIFHNANGYLGVRSDFEEGYPDSYRTVRGTYLNGIYDFTSMNQAEKLHGLIEEKQTMLNVVDTQGIQLFIDSELFSLFEGRVLEKSRMLDMEHGITERNVLWESASGKQVRVKITRMASFVYQQLFLVKYEVTPVNFSGKITLMSTHKGDVSNFFDPTDPRVAGEASDYLCLKKVEVNEDASLMVAETVKSGIEICSMVKNIVQGCRGVFEKKESSVLQTFHQNISQSQSMVLYKYTVLSDSLRFENCREAAEVCMAKVCGIPVRELYESQAKYLNEFWKNCALEIDGDENLQKAISYNMYQLLQSASKDSYGNIAAKGLSGEGYEGHYFWDTEMYMQPFFILNVREVAKNLIRYRYRTLEYARENARGMGHEQGVLFPWRTIMGRECSGYFPSGTAAYHINGDIAYSVISYYLAAGDIEFMEECGAELLVETGRLWVDMASPYHGKYHINEVTGPDEYTCMVNNNYYTNVLAQYNLQWAVKIIQRLKEEGCGSRVIEKLHITDEELDKFTEVAENIFLPYDTELGINPQDDSFLQKKIWNLKETPEDMFPLLMNYHPLTLYRYQVCKQADTVMAHFILEDAQSLETIRNSFDYYEKITTHDSSLSTCIFSIMAARLGKVQKAYEYFGESAKLDLFNTHKNTKDGIHTANMGGTYMAIVYGFGGLRIKENRIIFRPLLPEAWNGYKFSVLYQDSKITVEVDRKNCKFTLDIGTQKKIVVYEKEYDLCDVLTIELWKGEK